MKSKRDKYLLAKYGITEATYQRMLAKHDGACWICLRKPKPGKNLNVDHEHLTKEQRKAGVKFGKVRGTLCYYCNKFMVGRRRQKDIPMLRRLIQYLDSKIDWRTHGTNK